MNLTEFKALKSKLPKKRKGVEGSLQTALTDYVKQQYGRSVIIQSSSNGLRMPPGLVQKAKGQRSHHAFPDWQMFALSKHNCYGAQLLLELKPADSSVYLVQPFLGFTTQDHENDQQSCVSDLRKLGLWSGFGIGLDHARLIVDIWFGICKDTDLNEALKTLKYRFIDYGLRDEIVVRIGRNKVERIHQELFFFLTYYRLVSVKHYEQLRHLIESGDELFNLQSIKHNI